MFLMNVISSFNAFPPSPPSRYFIIRVMAASMRFSADIDVSMATAEDLATACFFATGSSDTAAGTEEVVFEVVPEVSPLSKDEASAF